MTEFAERQGESDYKHIHSRKEDQMRRLPLLLLASLAIIAAMAVAEAQQGGDPPPLRQRTLHQGELKLAPDPNSFKRPKRDTPLKDGILVRGTANIAAAWFSEPTTRYRHSPFGSEKHPTAITVSTAEKRIMKFRLPKDSVFEDRTPRLIDIDGDGKEDIVAVRSYDLRGSALAVIGMRGNDLEVIAETPPTGAPFRWLNPAGFADFDGDGRTDIALVTRPHTDGELQIWTLREGALVQLADTDDVSNHVRGSTELGLSAIADFNGDGRADIAIPNQDRRRLRFLTLTKGRIEELGEASLPAPAAESFSVVAIDGRPAVRVGLAGGRTVVVAPCRDIQDWEMADGSC